MSTNSHPKNISTTCFVHLRKDRKEDKKETIVPSFLQGFPGPQGLVGVPGEKVKRLLLAFCTCLRETERQLPDFHPTGASGEERSTGPARQ